MNIKYASSVDANLLMSDQPWNKLANPLAISSSFNVFMALHSTLLFQAKATRFLFNKESLYIQRRKKEIRQKNLEMAKQVAQKLPAFVELVDKAIQVHMLSLARNAVAE